mgnify:CR=1 FL=1
MDIEEDIKKLNKYIELVIDKDYCDCNELNVIIGKHCDGSKNVAYAIKNTLAEREEDKKKIDKLQVLEDDLKDKRIVYVDTPEFEEKFIAKQKVKEKIEENNKLIEKCKDELEHYGEIYLYEHDNKILKELLEDK